MNFPRYYRFDTHSSFTDTLAVYLLSSENKDAMTLARMLVLLPTRRACRALREACLRQSEGKPLLLPRILPIGEVDEEADIAAFSSGDFPPAMPEKRRLSFLTRLILQGQDTTPARAYQLAVELAKLLDEATRHGLGFENLENLVPSDLAEHWQKTTEFLSLITRQWPRILEAEGKRDAASISRQRVLSLAEEWRTNPPPYRVIAAGSTGSIPATAALLKTIASMPDGMVILPGLDSDMPDYAWDLIDPTHPQYQLKELLDDSKVKRSEVKLLNTPRDNISLRSLFFPAALTASWRETALPLEQDFAHLSFMEAATQQDEARMIAFKLREALETKGKTAALITPDRTLARMVAHQCARYGITIDDSAGRPLDESPSAIFMQLILEAIETGISPYTLLALLRHPFAAVGRDTATCREYSRILEAKLLRGVRFTSGMDALLAATKRDGMADDFVQFLTQVRECLRPLEMTFIRKDALPLSELIKLHITSAEALATTKEKSGADILWRETTGETLADLLASWSSEGVALGDIRPSDYPALFGSLVVREVTREPFGTHPRLHILSPVEARLTHYDLAILGEMDEGTWPAGITPDPWMSASMRETFGLPAHAASIGQSAHDVWMLSHGSEVIWSRARKTFGTPQKPARWWVRLHTLVQGKNPALLKRMDMSASMQILIETQDRAYEMEAHERPEPIPPHHARPRQFSVSNIDLWHRDPYAFYAQKILGLRELAPIDQEPDNRHFGSLIHAALENFSAEFPDHLPDHAYQRLIEHGRVQFEPHLHRPAIANLWWPRFEAIARSWLSHERELRKEHYYTRSEVSAQWQFELADERISFSARADRVDIMGNHFRLMDYKTGTPPSKKDVEENVAKQLPLTALALIRSGAVEATPSSLIYWALKTREQSKDYVEVEASNALLSRTEEELKAMIATSLNEETSYAAPVIPSGTQEEYDHLTRRSEWGAA